LQWGEGIFVQGVFIEGNVTGANRPQFFNLWLLAKPRVENSLKMNQLVWKRKKNVNFDFATSSTFESSKFTSEV